MENFVPKFTFDSNVEKLLTMASKTNQLLEDAYLTKEQLDVKFKQQMKKIAEEYVNLEDNDKWQHKEFRDKTEMKNRLTDYHASLQNHLSRLRSVELILENKADVKTTTAIRREMKNYATYIDFKDLYQKTAVPMQKFQD